MPNTTLLAVQDSSIGDLVTHSLTQSCFDFSDFSVHCKPIHFLKAYDNSYSKTAKEHKYKDKDDYKDKDKDKEKEKDKDAKTMTGTLTVCYIFGMLMTRQVQPSTAHFSLVPPSTV